MSEDKQRRFELAFIAWDADPVTLTDTSPALWSLSEGLNNDQQEITTHLRAYQENGRILPPPVPDRWQYGVTFTLVRSISKLRRHQQTGRNQVATRQLLNQAQNLKEVWDAYRGLTEP